jgi:hypothetical protein
VGYITFQRAVRELETNSAGQRRYLENGLIVLRLSTTISATNVRSRPLRASGLPLVRPS